MIESSVYYFTTKEWYALPLSVRQQWWRETSYGALKPSQSLLDLVASQLPDWKPPA